MEKPRQEQIQQQQQQQQQPFKCPRCESTNTKFCYYNNYSLSQPRHFCKSCKRYWTRGGTLRNVPLGGASRKNKRLKKPTPNSSPSNSTTTTTTTMNQRNTFISHSLNPMLYGFPLPSLSRVGLGFSSAGTLGGGDHRNGFSSPKQILQDLISNSNPSLLISSHEQQQKFNLETLLAYELDLQVKRVGSHGDGGLKLENDDHHHGHYCQIQSGYEIHDHNQPSMGASDSDPSILWNINNNSCNWLDPRYSSIGSSSSVQSLI